MVPPKLHIRWSTVIAVGILIASGMLAYANSFPAPFIFDGKDYIEQNSTLHTLWPLWAPMIDTMRPVGWLSFAINYATCGTKVWGYHATNLAIHMAAALTLFAIVRRTLSGKRLAARFGPASSDLALVVALLWLLHPLQTQSVTYIYQRFESLMGLFFLLTLYSVIRAQDAARPKAWQVSAVLCCLLAVMTKEVAAVAPLLVLWYDRAFIAASWREMYRRRWGLYAGLSSSWVVLAIIMNSQAEKFSKAGLLVVKGITPLQYAASQPGVIAHYLRLCLWPTGLCLDYAWPLAGTAVKVVPPLLLVAALLALTAWSIFRWPLWSFLGGWFFLILAPTSSIVPIVDLAFEHRMYLSLAAVVTGVVLGGYLLANRLLAGRLAAGRLRPHMPALIGYGLMGVIAMTLGYLTVRRNLDYKSATTIWEDCVQKFPQNARAHDNLGVALADLGELDAAIDHYRKALEIRPNLANAHFNFGVALANRGQTIEAIDHYRQALKIKPDYAEAHVNLGVALTDRGQINEAISHYRQALEIKPDSASAHYNFAATLDNSGLVVEAISHYRQALEIKPDYTDVLNNLAWILASSSDATLRNGVNAVEFAERAVKLSNSQSPEFLDTLAAAYAEAGRFPQAQQTARRALDLATQQDKPALAKSIQAKIQLYDTQTPFRETKGESAGQG